MSIRQKKIELSPRLRLGVSRHYSKNQILKYSTVFCIILASILAVNAFRLLFSEKSNFKPDFSPQVLGANDEKTLNTTPAVQFSEYKVQKGDTLFNLSQKFKISWSTLATLNNLKSPFSLKPGQILKIPNQ